MSILAGNRGMSCVAQVMHAAPRYGHWSWTQLSPKGVCAIRAFHQALPPPGTRADLSAHAHGPWCISASATGSAPSRRSNSLRTSSGARPVIRTPPGCATMSTGRERMARTISSDGAGTNRVRHVLAAIKRPMARLTHWRRKQSRRVCAAQGSEVVNVRGAWGSSGAPCQVDDRVVGNAPEQGGCGASHADAPH